MAGDNYTAKDHWKCLLACFLLSLSPFQYGVDFGLIGGMQAMVGFLQVRHLNTPLIVTDAVKIFGFQDPQSPIGWNLTPKVQQLISSLMTVGAFVGSLLAGPMSIWLTRRWCIWTACILCCASNGIMMGTTNLGGIYTGRLLIGIANGLYMVCCLKSFS